MKPSAVELTIFKTKDGLMHIGGYIPRSNKWSCDIYEEEFYDKDVIEWWNMPESNTGNKNTL